MRRVTYRFGMLLSVSLILLILIILDRNPVYLSPFIFLLFLLLGLYLTFPSRIDIEVKRVIEPKIIFPGDKVIISLSIRNKGDRIDVLRITDKVDGHLGRDYRALISIDGGSEAVFEYELGAEKRGSYGIGPLILEVEDPLGLVVERITAPPTELIVLPTYEGHGWVEMKSSVTGIWPGNVVGTRKGDGLEFRSIKPYSRGDQLRRINWKATSKHNKLMINEYEAEKVTDVLIVLDTSGLVKGDEYLVDNEVKLAASIAYSLTRMGNRVGLITHGASRKWIIPGFGKSHFLKLLEALSIVGIGHVIPLSNMVERLPRLMLKPGATVLIISPLLSIDSVRSAYILKMDGYRVSIISPFVKLEIKDERTALINRIRNIERINNMLLASKMHKIIPYSEYISPREVLKEALR